MFVEEESFQKNSEGNDGKLSHLVETNGIKAKTQVKKSNGNSIKDAKKNNSLHVY